MKLTYIYHSGFAIETERCIVIIDYYKDPSDVVTPLLKSDKKIYVLVSHFHPDHFNADVLTWKALHGDIVYLFSKDILRHRRAPKDAATMWLIKGDTYTDDNISVRAFGSTDSGDSFVIKIDGKRIFHAGDLNNWHWSDVSTKAEAEGAEKMYLNELKDICSVEDRVDVAMFPVDERIGSGYMRGAQQFVERMPTGLFVPMHFTATGYDSANAFAPIAEANGCKFWKLQREGQSIDI